MEFENSLTVGASASEVWATLMDIERVAPCLPGAEVLERVGGDTYKVGVKVKLGPGVNVKLGPISMLYRGRVEIVERDDGARRATMRAKAKEDLIVTFASNLAGMLEPRTAELTTVAETPPPATPQPAPAAAGSQPAPAAAGSQPAPAAAGSQPAPAAAGSRPATAPPPSPPAVPPPPPARPAPPGLARGRSDRPSVIAGRLRRPRTPLLATAGLALVSGAIGYAIGRNSR